MDDVESGLLEAFAVQSNARIPSGISGVGRDTAMMLRRLRRTIVDSRQVKSNRFPREDDSEKESANQTLRRQIKRIKRLVKNQRIKLCSGK
eukprot:9066270-Pyramimonas_sp.AAC.1